MFRKNISLPFQLWNPYKIDSTFTFCVTYIFQSISVTIFGVLFATVEILVPNIMEQMCSQIEIIISRLHQLSKLDEKFKIYVDICCEENKIIKDCIEHHILIFL